MPYACLCSFTFAVFAMLSFFFPQSSYFYLVYFKVTKEIELCTLPRIISHRNDSFAIQNKNLRVLSPQSPFWYISIQRSY